MRDRWLTMAEAARYLGVSRQCIHTKVQRGLCRCRREGKHVLVLLSDAAVKHSQLGWRKVDAAILPLGKAPDAVIARWALLSVSTVTHYRRERGIPRCPQWVWNGLSDAQRTSVLSVMEHALRTGTAPRAGGST